MKTKDTQTPLQILTRAQHQIDKYKVEWLENTTLSSEQKLLQSRFVLRYFHMAQSLESIINLFEITLKGEDL